MFQINDISLNSAFTVTPQTGSLTTASVSGTLTATTLGGTISTASQPNITQVGTLYSLDVSGNVSTNGTISGTLAAGTQSNITKIGTQYNLDVSGNTTTNMITVGNANGYDGQTLIKFNIDRAWQFKQVSTGGISQLALQCLGESKHFSIMDMSSNKIANFYSSTAGSIVTVPSNSSLIATLSSSSASQTNITQVGKLYSLDVSGTIATNGLITGTIATGSQTSITQVGKLFLLDISENLTVNGTLTANSVSAPTATTTQVGRLYSLDVSGNITCNGTISGTASQTSVTQVGKLYSLDVSGNVSVKGYVSQVNPSVLIFSLSGFVTATSGSELTINWDTTVLSVGSVGGGFTNVAFVNGSGRTRYYIVSYSLEFSGVNGGQSRAGIYLTSATGNVPNSVLADSRVVWLTGTATIAVANNANFTIKVKQDSGSNVNILASSYVSVTSL